MERYSDVAKTHGQPASPTRLGKEIMVFALPFEPSVGCSGKHVPITAKFGGATGNYNAHHVAYPEFDWKAFGNKFVAEKLVWSVKNILLRFLITIILAPYLML